MRSTAASVLSGSWPSQSTEGVGASEGGNVLAVLRGGTLMGRECANLCIRNVECGNTVGSV